MGELFPDFTTGDAATDGAVIHHRVGGAGDPVVLLHGYPQTGAMWHPVASGLARTHTVVIPDLRGYGASTVRDGDLTFRAMARDVVQLMAGFGFARFDVVGHDRGARAAHRMVLDHPGAVRSVAILDILPTLDVWRLMGERLSRAYFHWGWLARPEFARPMIGHDPVGFLHRTFAGLYTPLEVFHPDALAEYERAIVRESVIEAICGDYTAAATTDLEHDRADETVTPGLPALVLWGSRGIVGDLGEDPLALWRRRLPAAVGGPVDAGHFLVEERPDEVGARLREFLAGR